MAECLTGMHEVVVSIPSTILEGGRQRQGGKGILVRSVE